jgi:single-stranded-DNA-specific exonuclease
VIEPRWIFPAVDSDQAQKLALEFSLPVVVAQVLVARGYVDSQSVHGFLHDGLADLPDPFLMKGLPQACARILQAVAAQESVTLYGDYDVDGVSSTTLLTSFLKQVGLTVRTYIPHRLGEGYGLNLAAIEKLAQEGTKLLITLDCGITSHAEIARANALGLDVVVVDHHAVPEVMPPALAVLNPLQPGCAYPTRWLCAGGVTFNLCMGLRKKLREAGHFSGALKEPNLKQHLDLVALATVADVVPLTGANRILVKHGLIELTRGARPGIQALKDVAALSHETITASHVGFRLGPRINAAGRLDDASIGLQCLLATSVSEALVFAKKLDEANAERQQIEKKILSEAIEAAESAVARGARGLVLSSEHWHPGVVGIVASRIVERFSRPAVLIGVYDGQGKGSARSIEGFHLYDAIKSASQHLTRFGGHKAAAGLSIDPKNLEAFREAFEAVTLERLEESELRPRCRVDAVVSVRDLSEATVKAMEQLQPFGMGNPEPVYSLLGERVTPRVLQNKNPEEPNHLKLTLQSTPLFDVIGFKMGPQEALTTGPVDLAFKLSVDEFRGVKRMSLKLTSLRSSTELPDSL